MNPTEKTRVRRVPKRAAYDRASLDAILDAGVLCHVAYVFDGYPVVTPTIYWRDGDHVYWHGSRVSRMIKNTEGVDVCFSVTHLDGLVLARSAFHHSANYRSAMIFGKANLLTNEAEQVEQLKILVESLFPGRWNQLRPVSEAEIIATSILSMPIEEFSVKVRTCDPADDEGDMDWPVWAGVLPIRTIVGDLDPHIPTQESSSSAPDVEFMRRKLSCPH
jgi:uncharacterized protein